MNIILYSDDINLIIYWEKCFKDNTTILDEISELKNFKNSLIVLNYSALDSSQKEIISLLNTNGNLVLVLHRVPDILTAKAVLSYGAKGYGNALMKEHFLLSAIDTIKENMIWLHPEFTSQLINQIDSNTEKDISLLIEKLSQREKDVALLLKNGDTYKVIAENLNITPRTVKAHAQSIYSKLHVKDRLALALLLK